MRPGEIMPVGGLILMHGQYLSGSSSSYYHDYGYDDGDDDDDNNAQTLWLS